MKHEEWKKAKDAYKKAAANPQPDPVLLRLRSYVTRCAFAKSGG
jgi:hypothetical protein